MTRHHFVVPMIVGFTVALVVSSHSQATDSSQAACESGCDPVPRRRREDLAQAPSLLQRTVHTALHRQDRGHAASSYVELRPSQGGPLEVPQVEIAATPPLSFEIAAMPSLSCCACDNVDKDEESFQGQMPRDGRGAPGGAAGGLGLPLGDLNPATDNMTDAEKEVVYEHSDPSGSAAVPPGTPDGTPEAPTGTLPDRPPVEGPVTPTEAKRLENQNHGLREKLNMEDDDDSVDLHQVALDMSGKGDGDPSERVTGASLASGSELVTDFLRETSDGGLAQRSRGYKDMIKGTASNFVLQGSALSKSMPVQAAIYLVALAGVVFVLVATSLQLGAHHEEDELHAAVADAAGADGHHRRLGGGASPLLKNIAFCLTGCGLITFFVHVLKQPLILGYLLGGILVGPLGLQISDEHTISEIASLGLVFLLFMIGLELDVRELLKMGRVVLITGALQFPVCVATMYGIFLGIQGAGISLGSGQYSALYFAMGCSISSTMIVVKLLSENNEMGRANGRLSIGILIFQDVWAIVVLAIQPKISNPEVLGLLRTFAMIVVLIAVALAYAKFVMPAVLFFASKSVELMLVLSLSWCFFICCVAILPFVGLSMELAALIAGCALATFPYSAEFNGKIKYIRDFFITLFFAALGMKIPAPTAEAIFTAVLVAFVVLVIRWLGICLLVVLTGGGGRLGVLATINLSQISEFALVICSLGQQQSPPHIDDFTMTVVIWTFVILAILASFLIGNNHRIYRWMHRVERRVLKALKFQTAEQTGDDGDGDEDHHRDVVVLGFHRIAFMLVAEIWAKNPEFAKRLHVIDFNRAIHPHLEKRGVKCSYGDISAPDVLHHCFHGSPSLVLCTIPDSALQGLTNGKLLKVVREVWPTAHCIVTADSPQQAEMLYAGGADYVVRSAKLCAERLHDLVCGRSTEGGNELEELFKQYRKRDKDRRTSFLHCSP